MNEMRMERTLTFADESPSQLLLYRQHYHVIAGFQGYDYDYYENLQKAYIEAPCLHNSTHLNNATASVNSTHGEGLFVIY